MTADWDAAAGRQFDLAWFHRRLVGLFLSLCLGRAAIACTVRGLGGRSRFRSPHGITDSLFVRLSRHREGKRHAQK